MASVKPHSSITQARLEQLASRSLFGEEMVGVCVGCGEEVESIEPDAKGYQCQSCKLYLAYGAEAALLRFGDFDREIPF